MLYRFQASLIEAVALVPEHTCSLRQGTSPVDFIGVAGTKTHVLGWYDEGGTAVEARKWPRKKTSASRENREAKGKSGVRSRIRLIAPNSWALSGSESGGRRFLTGASLEKLEMLVLA